MRLYVLLLSLLCATARICLVNAAGEDLPSRLEINEIMESGAQWELLIQSLKAMQDADEDDVFSFFQLAAIHGVPPIPWDGVGQVTGGNPQRGFCTHSQINFIIWHRPYLALFEKVIISHAQRIASQYVGSDGIEYRRAAQTLRLPYWDWASNATLPRAVTMPTLPINLPNIGTTNIRNPFFSYSFHNFPFGKYPGMAGMDMSNYSESKRCADMETGNSNFTECTVDLEQRAEALKEMVYSVFTQSNTFEVMATQRSTGFTFETPHNEIHNLVGCSSVAGRNGHMKYTDWSSFDPIFFLHHANLDRLTAIWQSIYYNNSMFTQPFDGAAVYGTPAGLVYPDTPLKPFSDPSTGTFYTSNSARDVHSFDYTYPELAAAAGAASSSSTGLLSFKAQVAAALVRRVNALYDPNSSSSASSASSVSTSRTTKRRRATRKRRASAVPATANGGLGWTDYTVEISVDRAELPVVLQMPCSVDVYLGDGVDARRAGSVALLDMPTVGPAYGSVPLRRTLLALSAAASLAQANGTSGVGVGDADGEAGGAGTNETGASPDVSKLEVELEGGSRDDVVEALKESLRVVIRAGDGELVSPLLVRSLTVDVVAKRFVPRQSDAEFPWYGEVEKFPVIVLPLVDYQ